MYIIPLYRALGGVGVPLFAGWIVCARPDLLVLLTGVLELAGAAGLLFEATRYWAAWGLILLLAAMFPANVSAARRGVQLRGRGTTPLWLRTPMQVLFVGWAWYVR